MLRRGMMAESVAVGDPYWDYVVSVLNFGGASGSTSFIDGKGRTWYASGNAKIDTSLGYNAAVFDGSGDYIWCVHDAALVLGTADFCIERWVKARSGSFGVYNIFDARPESTNGRYMTFNVTPTLVGTYVNATDQIVAAHGVTITDLNHFAVIRHSGMTRIAVNGVTVGTPVADSSNYLSGVGRPIIGANGYATSHDNFDGWISGARMTKGVSRYGAGSFVPDTAPFLLG